MSAPELVARAFAVRTAAHLAHLQARTLSQHLALGSFYDDILGPVDDFCEVYQGLFDLIKEYPQIPVPTDEPLVFLVDFVDWLRKYRDACAQGETALENIIDETTAITARTIYKLRFLK
jgi:hypothetical protein